MLNKKGFTMMEIMVSIALISLIMIFLVKILIDVRYEGTNEIYDVQDQVSRAEILKTIQNDLNRYNIISITNAVSVVGGDHNANYTGVFTIDTETSGKTAKITVKNHELQYTSTDNKQYKWPLELAESNSHVRYEVMAATCSSITDSNTNDYIITLKIPVYMAKSNRSIRKNDNTTGRQDEIVDNTLDNITLTFYGRANNNYILCDNFY